MQAMSDADRDALTARHVSVDFGCDILNDAGNVVDDLTPDLVGGEVEHNGYANVHRTATLHTTRALDWPRVWLRPWQSVTGAGHTARFDVGVFRPTVPELPMGAVPLIYEVTCADRVSLLQGEIGDTRVSAAGSSVLDEARRAVVGSGSPGRVLVDSTSAGVLLDRDLVWVLSLDTPATFLRWTNDLLASIAYRGVYMTSGGDFMLERYRDPTQRAAEWTFDLTDLSSNIVEVDRSSSTNGWTNINWWRFVRTGLTSQPFEGFGVYTVDKTGGAAAVRRVVGVEAASQGSLVSQGDRIVTQDTSATRTVEITAGPMPMLGHFDVVDYIDPELGGTSLHCQVRSWTLDLASGQTHLTLEVPRG